jgi:hypothetical protein
MFPGREFPAAPSASEEKAKPKKAAQGEAESS